MHAATAGQLASVGRLIACSQLRPCRALHASRRSPPCERAHVLIEAPRSLLDLHIRKLGIELQDIITPSLALEVYASLVSPWPC